jgi:hypothetical protein
MSQSIENALLQVARSKANRYAAHNAYKYFTPVRNYIVEIELWKEPEDVRYAVIFDYAERFIGDAEPDIGWYFVRAVANHVAKHFTRTMNPDDALAAMCGEAHPEQEF